MPPGELRLPFEVSAVLLVVLEAVGAFLGLQMFWVGRGKPAESFH